MQSLRKDLIADTSICNLLMRVGRERFDVAIYSVVSDNSFIYRSFPLVSATRQPMGMLEDAIYDNPLLLADFRRAYCIVESQRIAHRAVRDRGARTDARAAVARLRG